MKPRLPRSVLFLLFLLLIQNICFAEIRLPKLISDGMVLQRYARTRVWGWASPGEKITLNFTGKTYKAETGADSKWQIILPGLKAGGPYEMQISGSNSITIHDILIGDVWICSGQSNMEMAMSSLVTKYPDDISSAENKFIRQFAVPKKHIFSRQLDDLASGSWVSADPKTVLRFTAAGYYFARDLYAKYKVPIGLINSTLGGSRTESWMSEESLKPFPELYEEALLFKDTNTIIQTEASDRQRIAEWNKRSRDNDAAYADPSGPWSGAAYDAATWDEITIPARWETSKQGNINGVVWFRRDFNLPSSFEGKAVKLSMGNIVESDSTFINGKYVGGMGSQYISRNYTIPAGLLKAGKNSITVRIVCPSGRGGFVPQKQYALIMDKETVDLSGTWKYKLGVKMEPLAGPAFIQWKSTGLYNAMLAPLLPYTIKGALWYQGESNIGRDVQQRTLFTTLITSWRNSWQQGDFPFLFVQLPNFNAPVQQPSDGGWARFREAQTAALALPNTGMAVAIDIGEWNDIHPLNKKDLGIRLSLAAQKVAYNKKKIVYAGPVYQSMKTDGNKIILSFQQVGGGLAAKGDSLHYFAIAGGDKKFVWANAAIMGNKVMVWAEGIDHPVAVRYAWADDPEGANLYNKEGLPAAPFRTDNY